MFKLAASAPAIILIMYKSDKTIQSIRWIFLNLNEYPWEAIKYINRAAQNNPLISIDKEIQIKPIKMAKDTDVLTVKKPDAIGLNFFMGWAWSFFKSIMSLMM